MPEFRVDDLVDLMYILKRQNEKEKKENEELKKDNDVLIESIEKLTEEMSDKLLESIKQKKEIEALKKESRRKAMYHRCFMGFVDPRCKLELPDRAFIIEWTRDSRHVNPELRDELLEDFGIDSEEESEEDSD